MMNSCKSINKELLSRFSSHCRFLVNGCNGNYNIWGNGCLEVRSGSVGTEKASFRALQLAEMGIAVAAHNGIEKYDNILRQSPGMEKDPALSDFFEFESDEDLK